MSADDTRKRALESFLTGQSPRFDSVHLVSTDATKVHPGSTDATSAEEDDVEAMLVKVQRKKKSQQTVHRRTEFGDKGRSLCMPKLIEETGHMGAPCEPHERIVSVERYGRVYKRKVSAPHKIRNDAPAGMRWCKMCMEFQPLDQFYTRVKRYVCKHHHWMRIKATIEKRRELFGAREYEHARSAFKFLKAACVVLGYERHHLDKTDIRLLIKHSKLPIDIRPIPCPIDPTRAMWPSNIAILSKHAFDLAILLYQMSNSRALFVATVQRCNLLSRNFDVSRLDNPWHDPKFERKDIDAAELLRAEEELGVFEPSDHAALALWSDTARLKGMTMSGPPCNKKRTEALLMKAALLAAPVEPNVFKPVG